MRAISDTERKEIEWATNRPLSSLYEEITYKYLYPDIDKDERSGTDEGYEINYYLFRIRRGLYQKLCLEWRFCERRNDPDLQDNVNLVASVADVIVSVTVGVPPVLIATILCKKGLMSFCCCDLNKIKGLLSHLRPSRRQWGLYVACALDPAIALPLITALKADSSFNVRKQVILSLAELRTPEAQEMLRDLGTNNADERIKMFAAGVLTSYLNP